MASVASAQDICKKLVIKDLRIQCRARGISPAGSRETLIERLAEHMAATGDFDMRPEGTDPATYVAPAPPAAEPMYDAEGIAGVEATVTVGSSGVDLPKHNNYARPDGQNTGNFITNRPTSRVLAPPGGTTSVTFG